jgi:hypothetical protein
MIKRLLARRMWRFLFTITVVLLLQGILVFSQTEAPVPVPADFPLVLLVPLIIGMVLHWLKGYGRGTITVNFFQYILDSLGQTITALLGAVASFIGLYSANPIAYDPHNVTAWISVILIGYSFDSALNGTGSFIKKEGT